VWQDRLFKPGELLRVVQGPGFSCGLDPNTRLPPVPCYSRTALPETAGTDLGLAQD
jgi:hypothetical protein